MASYSKHYDALVAITTYLATCRNYDAPEGNPLDSASAEDICSRLHLDEQEVQAVLNGFPGLFRASKEPTRYSLLMRYSRRDYSKGLSQGRYQSDPLSNEELLGLLEFIKSNVFAEQEERRHDANSRFQRTGIWVAAVGALLAFVASLLQLVIK